jgi:diguanylate cyclase (GGDEF)-like protein
VAQWRELTAQKLLRYEALFRLLEDIQHLEDVAEIAQRVATQWKYVANVIDWRLVIPWKQGFRVIDGYRGEAHLGQLSDLPAWDAHHWQLRRPRLVRLSEPRAGPLPPPHLGGQSILEVQVIPFVRAEGCIGLLSAAARHEPFTDLDNKFIHLFGRYLVDLLTGILLRAQVTESLISKATHDALTGLLNRAAILDWLAGRLALARRAAEPLSVILADIDYFKIINDSWGHLAGDQVLGEVSRRLQLALREGDGLGRYGGEEFLFVLYPCGPAEVEKAAERFRQIIAGEPFPIGVEGAGDLSVTISLGTASTAGGAELKLGIEGLLKQADNALYHSKARGRNRVTSD